MRIFGIFLSNDECPTNSEIQKAIGVQFKTVNEQRLPGADVGYPYDMPQFYSSTAVRLFATV